MNNLPKFISIRKKDNTIVYINVTNINTVYINDYRKTVEFELSNSYNTFYEDDYPTAKAAWIEVWKATP